MKRKKIINNLFSIDEFTNLIKNKIIHIKNLGHNSLELDKREIQDIKVFDSFHVSSEEEASFQIKYSLEDFDLNGFNPSSSECRKNHSYDDLSILKEYICVFSDSNNIEKITNVIMKEYDGLYHFRISDKCFGIIQIFNSSFLLEFNIIEISNTIELMTLLSFIYGLDVTNHLIITKNNNMKSLSIFLTDNIKKKISKLGLIIAKLVYIEDEFIHRKFIVPKTISKKTINNINSLYFVARESELPSKHKIIMDCRDDFDCKFFEKNYLYFKSNVDVKPKLEFNIFGYHFEFKIKEFLLKDVILQVSSQTNKFNNSLSNTNLNKVKCKSEKIFIRGSSNINYAKPYFSSSGSLGWYNKFVIRDQDNKFFESDDERLIKNKFDLMLLTDKDNVINNNISIYRSKLCALKDIIQINGNISIYSNDFYSLGNLRIVNGSFDLASYKSGSKLYSLENLYHVKGDVLINDTNIKDLGNLEFVDGDLNLRFTKVISLNRLKRVGGKLNLRDTNCTDLGTLEFVGGDLFLPKKYKDNIDVLNIEIRGKIRYWKDIEKKIYKPIKIPGMVESTIKIPHWDHDYFYSFDDSMYDNIDQKKFYNYYKKNFMSGNYIELPENSNYIFVLFFDLIKMYQKKLNKLNFYFKKLATYYPITQGHAESKIIELYENKEDYESSWDIIKESNYIHIPTLIDYTRKLNRQLVTPDLMIKLGGWRNLTKFGLDNIEHVKKKIPKLLKKFEHEIGESFLEIFIKDDLKYGTEEFDNYYKSFYINEEYFELCKSWDDNQIKQNYRREILHTVEKSIIHQILKIYRDAENLYREDIGLPKIGEGWIQETELFYKISNIFSKYKVVQHGKPKWLGRQHLDIYFPDYNIAIEFQGEQHFKPVDFFGGEESFKKVIELDRRKKKLCDENNCELLYVISGYDFNEIVDKINLIIDEK